MPHYARTFRVGRKRCKYYRQQLREQYQSLLQQRDEVMNSMSATTDISAPTQKRSAAWINICDATDLLPDTGVCALVHQQQIAIFYSRRLNEYFATANYDPISEANVLSRGIIGSLGDAVVVASPLYKQHFNLRTGECLENPEHKIATYPVRVQDGQVQVCA